MNTTPDIESERTVRFVADDEEVWEAPSLGRVINELTRFVRDNPNPTEEPREIRFEVDDDGALMAFTVYDGRVRRPDYEDSVESSG